jgi:acyl-CoA thioesterase II
MDQSRPDAVIPSEAPCDAWDQQDIQALVSLEPTGPLRYRSRYGDANLNGRSYGGQILGQAMMAATLSVPEDRQASALQLLFLSGAKPDRRIDFEVRILQEGKRFSSRHVLGVQGDGKTVLSAHATFCTPQVGPQHSLARFAPSQTAEHTPRLSIIPPAIMQQLRPLGPYSNVIKPCMDFRIPDIERQLSAKTAQARLEFWLRGQRPVSPRSRAHAAVFAYLSDWWLNFSSVGSHLIELESREPLYVSSLNHCIWFHRAFSPYEWMHVETEGPCAAGGRGLSTAHLHDQRGMLLASLTQESLMVHPDEDRQLD